MADQSNYLSMAPIVAGLIFSLAIIAGLGSVLVFVIRKYRGTSPITSLFPTVPKVARLVSSAQPPLLPRKWLAIKSANPLVVQSTLGLHNLRPCFWQEGLEQVQDKDLIVSPAISGWILVAGGGLPSPEQDIDQCFLLLRRLSRDLGTVQYFSCYPALNHHTWAMAQEGHVVRAYSWAGETLWNQGSPTDAELQLNMFFADYGEKSDLLNEAARDGVVSNTENLAKLAKLWSIDPSAVQEQLDASNRSVMGNLTTQGTRI